MDTQLQQEESVFGFAVTEQAQSYLRTSAKWEKFLAWVNLILLGLGILFCLFGSTFLQTLLSANRRHSYYDRYDTMDTAASTVFTFVFIFYALILGVFIIPNIFRLKFANKCLTAIEVKDEELLAESFKNLKIYSTFWGILTIIGIAIYLLMFLFLIIGAAATSGLR